jgi:hypothetical protein
VTIDLELLSNDKHLDLLYNPQVARETREQRDTTTGGDPIPSSVIESERWNNFGFKELRTLEGNVGYLDLRVFFASKYAGETGVAVMSYFSNCNALIIDLRRNGGGWDDMVVLLASYFFDNSEAIIFNISHSTLDSTYYTSMTLPYVPGKLLTDIPLYILVSGATGSAAEAFANIMKNLREDATLVGETTAGAENPVEHLLIGDDFILRIPAWKKVYSYAGSSWEGRGVEPDILVEPSKALDIAHMKALTTLQERAADLETGERYQWAIDGVEATQSPVSVDGATLRSYAGQYGTREIVLESGNLYYRYRDRSKRRMFAISKEYFLIEGYDSFRVKFIRNEGGVVGFDEFFTDGSVVRCGRNK